MGTKERYERVAREVERVCVEAGRDPREVRLVAVSKTVGEAQVACAMEGGALDFGENRPDEILRKSAAFPQARWHFIGNVQSRRIPDIVGAAALVHSLYQEHHVARFDVAAARLGKVQDVLLEVNVSKEKSKSGVAPEDAHSLLEACAQVKHLRVRGLMTMAPQGDAAVARECFEGLARLRDELRAGLAPCQAAVFNELSMGMSEDWREAVCAGATIVRIGRAVFDSSFENRERTAG